MPTLPCSSIDLNIIDMDEMSGRHKLQKEIDRLTTLLQLSERKRFNQKILYDKNLENLHEKLADFENVLNKERKEIQQILQKKEQQIKVREDLAKALQEKLDNKYCRQCGYPSRKNQFDTDWEIGIDDEKKTDKYRKLPPLSLPLPEILPNVSFASRFSHAKSKLSPVAEECEVASSSYLRNIHADQNPDRFHAVLTASLECLQVDKASKKNITPESENADDDTSLYLRKANASQNPDKFHAALSASLDKHSKKDHNLENEEDDVHTPTFTGLPMSNSSKDDLQQQLCPRKLELCEDNEDDNVHESIPRYQPPRPSIVIETCEDLKKKNEMLERRRITKYANDIACSILQYAYKHAKRSNSDNTAKTSTSVSDVSSNIQTANDEKKVPQLSSKSLQSFSDKLALGILTRMTPDIKCDEQKRRDSVNSFGSDICDSSALTCDDMSKTRENAASSTPVKMNHPLENGGIPMENINEKPRSFAAVAPVTEGTNREKQNSDYSRLSSVVVPLVDQAFSVAKTIVRRRSSTNFLVVDESISSSSTIMKEKLDFNDEGEIQLSDVENKELDNSDNSGNDSNLSFNRKTLIELIDQAVEQVVPTDNCSKDNIDPPPSSNLSTNSTVCANNSGAKVKSNSNRPVVNGNNPIVENGVDCDHNENDDEDDTLSTTIVSESCTNNENQNENKENEISKSKKKKNKKKKRKKKASICENGANNKSSNDTNGVAEQQQQQQQTDTTKMANGVVITDVSPLECSFDAEDVVTSSLNNSVVVETELNTSLNILIQHDSAQDKFSLLVDQSFNEMEASRGSTPDTLDGF